jgi:hypothetical protein
MSLLPPFDSRRFEPDWIDVRIQKALVTRVENGELPLRVLRSR